MFTFRFYSAIDPTWFIMFQQIALFNSFDFNRKANDRSLFQLEMHEISYTTIDL